MLSCKSWSNDIPFYYREIRIKLSLNIQNLMKCSFFLSGVLPYQILTWKNIHDNLPNLMLNYSGYGIPYTKWTGIQNYIFIVNQRHTYATRNATNVYQHGYRTNSGKHLTSRIIAIEYNLLPTNIRNSQSIHTFKKHTKALLFNS